MKVCFVCKGKASRDVVINGKGKLIDFDEKTYTRCVRMQIFRKFKNFKYSDVEIPPMCDSAFHSHCYSKFVILKPRYKKDLFFKMPKSNAEKCKTYRDRVKNKNKTKKVPLTNKEKCRMYRLRKKMLAQRCQSSTNQDLYIPSTLDSQTTFGSSSLLNTNARICSDHFKNECFLDSYRIKKELGYPLGKIRVLKPDAIPTEKLPSKDTSNTATENQSHIDIKEEPIDIKDEPIIGIKQESIIDIKQEPIDPLQEDSRLPNYECSTSQIVQKSDVYQNPINIVKVEGIPKGYDENEQFRNDCLQFANFVAMELQKLSDYNSLEVAKQCIRSIILDAQNGVYKSGVLPQIVSMPTNSAVKSEPSE